MIHSASEKKFGSLICYDGKRKEYQRISDVAYAVSVTFPPFDLLASCVQNCVYATLVEDLKRYASR